jgi:uncharacterized lipoprotein YajG
MKYIFVVLTIFLLTGCNNKKEHFDNGGTLICIEKHFFTQDKAVFINKSNARYSSSGRYDFSSGFIKNGNFFNIDDCVIK